jgi:secondary thiamine-phosphate synthase enzyme
MTQTKIILPKFDRGYHLITDLIYDEIGEKLPEVGLLHLFIQHTSASIMINENFENSVRVDLESAFNDIVKEDMPYYTHTTEGSDDMPAHIKSAMIGTDITIPITNGRLNLGQWQGVYICEFRNNAGRRKLIATIIS